jgi:zinc/manganese transport system permease protein
VVAVLSTALLTGPAATWLGILLAYDSFCWSSSGRGWPVGFVVVALVLIAYLLSYARSPSRGRRAGRATEARKVLVEG